MSSPHPAITARSVVLGALTVAAVNHYTNYAGLVLGSSTLIKSQFSEAMLLFFVLWTFVNVGLKAFVPRAALSSTELLVIFSMAWVGGNIPLEGWAAYLVSTITVPTFYASPENRWVSVIFDRLPWWTLADRAPGVVVPFFNGLAPGEAIPWAAWARPTFWWTAISLAVLGSGICVSVIFQRQWEEAERLTFPLARFAAELTEGFDARDRVPAIFRDRVFWFGFFAVFGVFLWNIVGYFHHELPRITLFGGYESKAVALARSFPPIYLRVLPSVIGLTYFCDLDILFSIWALRLLAIVKLGVMDRTGFSAGLSGQQARAPEIIALESHGALVFLALWTVWVARGHLRDVWRQALSPSLGVDGLAPGEAGPPYRRALAGLCACTAFIVGWMMAAGASLPVALLQTALLYIAYLSVAKFTAASGFTHLLPVYAKGGGALQTFVGTRNMLPGDFIAVELVNSSAFFGNDRIPAWPALPHHLKLHGQASPTLVGTATLAFTIGLLVSFLGIVALAYTHGAQNLHTSPFEGRSASASVRVWEVMTSRIEGESPTLFDLRKVSIWSAGLLEAGAMVYLRNRFGAWPLHPLGLAFQNTIGPVAYSFSIFLTWASKFLLLRIGGITLYRRGAPFFIALPVGYFAGIAVSSLVDILWFPTGGHGTHGW